MAKSSRLGNEEEYRIFFKKFRSFNQFEPSILKLVCQRKNCEPVSKKDGAILSALGLKDLPGI
jgi:hypothetical protein